MVDVHESKLTFVEIVQEVGPVIGEALRIYANVQSPIEEKPKSEWDSLIEQLKNKPTKK